MFARRDYIRDYMMIPPGTGEAAVVNLIVEIPKGRRSKFEVDKITGLIKLDRYLYSSAVYPGDYGFIPQTLAEDDDPLDILVMVNEPTFSGCLIEARVVGIFRMRDKGHNDFKVLAVPHQDPLFATSENWMTCRLTSCERSSSSSPRTSSSKVSRSSRSAGRRMRKGRPRCGRRLNGFGHRSGVFGIDRSARLAGSFRRHVSRRLSIRISRFSQAFPNCVNRNRVYSEVLEPLVLRY